MMSEITDNNGVPDEQSQNDFQNAENADPNSQNIIPVPMEQTENNFQNNTDPNSQNFSSTDEQSEYEFQKVVEQDLDDDESDEGVSFKCDFCNKEIETHWYKMKVCTCVEI